MLHLFFRFSSFRFLIVLCLAPAVLYAQKAGLEVTRCSAIDRSIPLINVAVDASGRKWAANKNGIYQIKATDLSTPLKLASDERNVLAYRGGNADFSWSESAFRNAVKEPCSVTTAWYDAKNKHLYLGTDEAGLIRFITEPEFKFDVQWKTVNSKLKSNNITIVFQDASARIWVGTDQGLMYGPPGRWKSDLSGTNVQRVREFNTVIYVLADGYISKAPGGEKWSDLALEEKHMEGEINDFDIDPSGKMWLVSGNLTRFDMIANTYDDFGGSEYYTSQYGNCIAVDSDGAVWVGTEDKGLYFVDKAYNMVLNAYVEKPISCEGDGKDAVLMAKVTGGVPPYTYTWSGGLSGESPKNVPAGNYSVTVTDSKGKARNADIGLPDSRLKVKARQKKPISAPGASDGVGEVDLATNASGIVVAWDNGEVLATATKLSAGEHTVTVTDPKGCSTILKVTITEVAQPVAATISEKTPIKCAAGKAVLTVEVKGGKAPYTYAWSNPAIVADKPDNVPAGTYTVTVTDATKATSTATIVVRQPDALIVSALVQAPASTGGSDGKALAQAKGGTGVYNYKWDNGEVVFAATKLPPGNRSITVTDMNGCTASATFEIPENILKLTVSIAEKGQIKCAGEKSSLAVEVKGGKGAPKFSWSNPALAGDKPDNVSAGDYTLTVTDVVGNTATATIKVKSPQPFTASAIAQGVVSPGGADGKALAMTTGGTGTHYFKWDNGEITAATVALTAGLHTVTVTDDNGCTTTASVTMTETVLPLEISIAEKSAIKCAGEKAALDVKVNGGKTGYKFNWNAPSLSGQAPTNVPPGTYSLTVTDAAGTTKTASITVAAPPALSAKIETISPASTGGSDGKANAVVAGGATPYTFRWDNGESTAGAVRLSPGSHGVTITDANGCQAMAGTTTSENILPLALTISETAKIKCTGEKTTLSVQVSGGKAPFRYAWNSPAASGESPSVSAGDYVLTVSDAAGNSKTATVSVTAPAALTVQVDMMAPASAGNADGKAMAKPVGGKEPYIFQWESGESSNTASRLAPGNPKVTVTDANGCTAVGSVSIAENILGLVVTITEKNQIKCGGLEKASLVVNISGGKKPFSIAWNNPAVSGEAPDGLVAGDYAVTVTDAKGTSQSAKITVVSPEPIVLELVQNIGASSATVNDGKAKISIKGGTAPYKTSWDTKQSGLSVSKLSAGKHSVTVTDAAGCSQALEFETGKRAMPELTRAIEQGQTIPMRLLTFETDSASLRPAVYTYLDELFVFLEENPGITIEVAGHTNNQPKDDFADYLSTARAKAVASYLLDKGIDPKRVQYKGYGKRQPLVPNTTPEGRRTNQRVEIKILTANK
ncbi:MAG: OmpA family protein [Saprospiraceae bacterium]|nr:OmpA family protein [Saprospiraceae bacterium]